MVSNVFRTGDTVLGSIELTLDGSILNCMLLLESESPLTATVTLVVVVPLKNWPVMHLSEVEETATGSQAVPSEKVTEIALPSVKEWGKAVP